MGLLRAHKETKRIRKCKQSEDKNGREKVRESENKE
jgi:hypothetical protein